MTALQIQREFNTAYANRSYKKAIRLYKVLAEKRKEEGVPELILPNLEKKMKNI